MKKKNIVEWFDPCDIKHVMAYREVLNKRDWPKGFVPDGIIFTHLWFDEIAMKIVRCWIAHMISVTLKKNKIKPNLVQKRKCFERMKCCPTIFREQIDK